MERQVHRVHFKGGDLQDIQSNGIRIRPQLPRYNNFGQGWTILIVFVGIDEMWRGNMEAYAHITAPDCAVNSREAKSYLLHPTILDASFQTLIGCISNLSGSYLPVKISKIVLSRPCHSAKFVVHAVS